MKRSKPGKRKLPKGIRRRVLKDGTEMFDALVKIDGKQKSMGSSEKLSDALALRHAYFKNRAKETLRPAPKDTGKITVRRLGELCPMNEWDEDRWRARVMEMAEFADWDAADVLDEHVQIWVDKMATTPIRAGRGMGQPPTRGTVYSALSLLDRVYTWAKMPARKYVTHNPCDGVTIRNSTDVKLKSRRNVLDYLREDEAKRLHDVPRDVLPLEPRTKFVVLMFSGARPSDVWRLRWERIDWAAESTQFTSAKTSKEEARDYTVHMLPQLLAALREWWMASGRPTEGLVFPSEVGEVYKRGYDGGWSDKRERRKSVWRVDATSDRALSARTRPKEGALTGEQGRALRREQGELRESRSELKITPGWRTKIGIKRNVPLYALRHTCACQLLLGGDFFAGGRMWSREEVQSQLGHKDSKATEFYMLALGILGRRAALESKAAIKALKKKPGTPL